jgi:hypothetical protein
MLKKNSAFIIAVFFVIPLSLIFLNMNQLGVNNNFYFWFAFLLIFLLGAGSVIFALWKIIDDRSEENGDYQEIARSLQTVLVPIWIGTFIIFIASIDSLSKLAINLSIGGAALASGSFLGVLFGIPRSSSSRNNSSAKNNSSSSDSDLTNTRSYYADNTNIEEISDWLTKILVGIGLVQLTKITTYISKFQEQLKNPEKYAIFEVSIVILFTVWGFFLGYLSARLFLPTAFSRSLKRQLEKKDEDRKSDLKDRDQQQNLIAELLQGINSIESFNKLKDSINRSDIELLKNVSTKKLTRIESDFKRNSVDHQQLRELRRMNLLYPVEGGKWDSGKTIKLTAYANSFLEWLKSNYPERYEGNFTATSDYEGTSPATSDYEVSTENFSSPPDG